MSSESGWNVFPGSFYTGRFAEEIKLKNPTREQMEELEKAWLAAPVGLRLEAVAGKAMELGLEIISMRRDRSHNACAVCNGGIYRTPDGDWVHKANADWQHQPHEVEPQVTYDYE